LTARLPRRGRAHSRAGSCLDGEPSYFDGTPSNQPDQLAGPKPREAKSDKIGRNCR
jgi:hypothetical protein